MIEELNKKQNARVAALKQAREVLSKHSGGPFNSTVESADTLDLVAIATFIIDGKDPWRRPTTKKQKSRGLIENG